MEGVGGGRQGEGGTVDAGRGREGEEGGWATCSHMPKSMTVRAAK
jgi:hypothetical protein